MNRIDTGALSRLIRRLLIFVCIVLVVGASGANATPVKTLVQDTLYRADGSVARGSVTIRWSGFSTSAGEAVPAGQMTVTTDGNGGISIPLIPNTGASPSGGCYRVVIALDDGTTSEEMWVVPAVSTTTVAAIRAKVVPQAVAAQFASRDYLDSELAGLATVASSGNYNDLVNKPTTSNLAAPGAIGSTTPGPIYASSVAAGTTVSGATNGVLNPAACSISNPPSWCSGPDICAQVQSAVSALPSTGGEVDLRGLNGVQATCAGGIDLSAKPIILRIGKAVYTLGGSLLVGPYSKIKGAGKTASGSVIQFSNALASTTDAITMYWSGTDNDMATAEIDDVFINPQNNGEDALRVRGGRNWKLNVQIENAGRDCLVIGGDQAYRWTEQATVDAEIFGCGRYGLRLDTSAGTSDFITHLTFPHLHIGATTSNPIYVNMSSGSSTSSSGVQEVSFADIHIMSSFANGSTTDAIYFACNGGTNNYAAYWNFYNGEIENSISSTASYILNGQAGCMLPAIFGNMWLDGRWGGGLYNSATVQTPTILSGQYSNMAGIQFPSGMGEEWPSSSQSNHLADLFVLNNGGGLQYLFGGQQGNVQNGSVLMSSARVLNSGAPQAGIICPSAWAGSGLLQQWGCIGVTQDGANAGPKWNWYVASTSGGNSAPVPSPVPVATLDHLGNFVANSYANGNAIIIPSTLTGFHGTSGSKVQLSDGSGTSGHLMAFAVDGSATDGGAPPTTAATQSPLDSSTKFSTTAYTDAAVAVETARASGVESGKAASNASTTVNGTPCALGTSCTVADSSKIPTSWIVATSGNYTSGGYTGGASPLIPTTSGGDQIWSIGADCSVTTAGTAGGMTVIITWTDAYGSHTNNLLNDVCPFATAGATSSNGAVQIHVKTGTAVTYTLNNNSASGSYSIQLDITATRKL